MSTSPQDINISTTAIRGTAWRYVAMFTGKLMVFISTVVLARLLTKDDFGLVGYAVTVITFLEGISDLGVTAAIIYYPEDKNRVSTGFWINQITAILFFALTWFLAPSIAEYFRDDRVINVTRALALTFPFLALGYTHESVLMKKLSFKQSFIPSFLKSVVKGVASIGFALTGFGAWSLIWGQLAGTLISSIAYWMVSPWRPDFVLKLQMAYELIKYGTKFITSELISTILINLDYILVGRYLGSEALGVYTIAFRMPDLLILEFARTITNVLFPIYSKMREQADDMSRAFFLATRYISLLTIPMGLGLAVLAKPFIITFFTEKWIEAVPVVQAIAIYATLLSIVHNTSSVYWAEGRPQILTWLGITRLLILFPALFWAVSTPKSIIAVGWMQAIVALISALLNLTIASRLIRLPIIEIVKALTPAVVSGSLMAVIVYFAVNYSEPFFPAWVLLIEGVFVGGIAYIISLWFLQRDVVLSVKDKIFDALGRS